MDDADITAERSEYDHIANVERSRRPEAPGYVGHCLNCQEPLPAPRRFCDHDCMSDYQLRNGMR